MFRLPVFLLRRLGLLPTLHLTTDLVCTRIQLFWVRWDWWCRRFFFLPFFKKPHIVHHHIGNKNCRPILGFISTRLYPTSDCHQCAFSTIICRRFRRTSPRRTRDKVCLIDTFLIFEITVNSKPEARNRGSICEL